MSAIAPGHEPCPLTQSQLPPDVLGREPQALAALGAGLFGDRQEPGITDQCQGSPVVLVERDLCWARIFRSLGVVGSNVSHGTRRLGRSLALPKIPRGSAPSPWAR